jgi:hypothetical protein
MRTRIKRISWPKEVRLLAELYELRESIVCDIYRRNKQDLTKTQFELGVYKQTLTIKTK